MKWIKGSIAQRGKAWPNDFTIYNYVNSEGEILGSVQDGEDEVIWRASKITGAKLLSGSATNVRRGKLIVELIVELIANNETVFLARWGK